MVIRQHECHSVFNVLVNHLLKMMVEMKIFETFQVLLIYKWLFGEGMFVQILWFRWLLQVIVFQRIRQML